MRTRKKMETAMRKPRNFDSALKTLTDMALWRRRGGRAFKAEAEERNQRAGRHRYNQNRPA